METMTVRQLSIDADDDDALRVVVAGLNSWTAFHGETWSPRDIVDAGRGEFLALAIHSEGGRSGTIARQGAADEFVEEDVFNGGFDVFELPTVKVAVSEAPAGTDVVVFRSGSSGAQLALRAGDEGEAVFEYRPPTEGEVSSYEETFETVLRQLS